MKKRRFSVNGQAHALVRGSGKCEWLGREFATNVARVRKGVYSVIVDGSQHLVALSDGECGTVRATVEGAALNLGLIDPRKLPTEAPAGSSRGSGHVVRAPMPGRVVAVLVAEGERVAAGQGLVVIEAMKMQNELRATADALVRSVTVKPGDSAGAGEILVSLE